MKTHLELDEQVLQQVCKLGQFSTKKAAINTALAEYLKLLKYRELLALRGELNWQGDLDALRQRRQSNE